MVSGLEKFSTLVGMMSVRIGILFWSRRHQVVIIVVINIVIRNDPERREMLVRHECKPFSLHSNSINNSNSVFVTASLVDVPMDNRTVILARCCSCGRRLIAQTWKKRMRKTGENRKSASTSTDFTSAIKQSTRIFNAAMSLL